MLRNFKFGDLWLKIYPDGTPAQNAVDAYCKYLREYHSDLCPDPALAEVIVEMIKGYIGEQNAS